MISSRHRVLWASLLASATFACAGAHAQAPVTTPSPAAAQAPTVAPPHAPPQRMDRAQRFERMQAHRTQRLAALKDKLQLTPAQEGAWSSFAAAQQPPARPAGAARPDRAEFAKLTTPQRLDRMQARQAERSANFSKRIDATRSFYAALTPAQQQTFDAEAMRRGGPGHRRGAHHGEVPAQS